MATGQLEVPAPAAPSSRPDLTGQQKQLILSAAGELVSAAVMGRPATIADGTLGGAADHLVAGSFVSLKRRSRLRSCCGMLTQAVPLGQALQDAAWRTAKEDVRFPQVSPTELEHLELEVWVLYAPEPVPSRGEERVRAVTVGKHGLQVVRGEARGLLLPGVAVENNWDARQFLDEVCVKAGLHPSLWKDDATALFTFEGEAIHGRVLSPDASSGTGAPAVPAPLFGPEEMAAYLEFCRGNIVALLRGATPNYYLFGVPDCNVNGVVLSVSGVGQGEPLLFSQLSLRPGVPLQATIYNLAQAAARDSAGRGIWADQLDTQQIGLAILYDAAMHGTVADSDLAGIDPQHRMVLVTERNKTGWVFDRQRTSDQLVSDAAEQARVSNPAAAAVFSLATLTMLDRFVVSTAPRAVRGGADRSPAVAGSFYAAEPSALSRMVDEMIAGDAGREPWPAAMVPHAGLIYSGRIAASVLKRIQIPRTVIVIGPKHTPLGVEWAVAPQQTWSMPGFTIESDTKLVRRLAQAIPGLELDALAHQREHAIEVELPFIARLAPETHVVGIAIGSGGLESCRRFAEGLANVLRDLEERPLLVISSDMNHFATDAETRVLDEMALSALDRLDPADLYKTVTENRISMCGVLPAVIVMETLRLLGGLTKAERVGYATTADVTGDPSRVVGYAGMLFG